MIGVARARAAKGDTAEYPRGDSGARMLGRADARRLTRAGGLRGVGGAAVNISGTEGLAVANEFSLRSVFASLWQPGHCLQRASTCLRFSQQHLYVCGGEGAAPPHRAAAP